LLYTFKKKGNVTVSNAECSQRTVLRLSETVCFVFMYLFQGVVMMG